MLLALLIACTDEAGRDVRARTGSHDTSSDTGDPSSDTSGDSGDTSTDTSSDTGDTSPHTTCEALSDARARCAVTDAWRFDDDQATTEGSHKVWSTTTSTLEPGIAFDGLVVSWNAVTPTGTWVQIEVEARVGGAWTSPYVMAVWASGSDTIERHSVDGQSDSHGTVYTDTLYLRSDADAARITLRLYAEGSQRPSASRLTLAVADTSRDHRGEVRGTANGIDLAAPARSQMEFDEGEAWCSPTSMSMLMAFHGVDVSVPEAAEGTWDSVYQGNGNWPFNTAYAGARGLVAEVGWFDSLAQVEDEIAAGRPVAISAAWSNGDIDNAAIPSTSGHLLVIDGFTSAGNVQVNDPAASTSAEVSRVYTRDQIEAAWLDGSGGVVYRVWR